MVVKSTQMQSQAEDEAEINGAAPIGAVMTPTQQRINAGASGKFLTPVMRKLRGNLEVMIQRCLDRMEEEANRIGLALLEIQEKRLWDDGAQWKSFSHYAADLLGKSTRCIRRLLRVARTIANIERHCAGTGDVVVVNLPQNVLLEISSLPTELQPAGYDMAGGDAATVESVQRVQDVLDRLRAGEAPSDADLAVLNAHDHEVIAAGAAAAESEKRPPIPWSVQTQKILSKFRLQIKKVDNESDRREIPIVTHEMHALSIEETMTIEQKAIIMPLMARIKEVIQAQAAQAV